MRILVSKYAGTFAENKDVARELRVDKIIPALTSDKEVVLDFANVTGATQSFVHALISDVIRQYGDDVFDYIVFKNCSPVVKEVIVIVTEYMQES